MTSSRISSDKPRPSRDAQTYGSGKQSKAKNSLRTGKSIQISPSEKNLGSLIKDAEEMLSSARTAQFQQNGLFNRDESENTPVLQSEASQIIEDTQAHIQKSSEGFKAIAQAIQNHKFDEVWPDAKIRADLQTTLRNASTAGNASTANESTDEDNSFDTHTLQMVVTAQKEALDMLAQKVKDACESTSMRDSLKKCKYEDPNTDVRSLYDEAKTAISKIAQAQKFAQASGMFSKSNCSREEVKKLTSEVLIRSLQNLNTQLANGLNVSRIYGPGSY